MKTQEQTMTSPYPEVEELMKIYLIEINPKYAASKACAVVIANDPDQAYNLVCDQCYEVEGIKFIGYADMSFTKPKVIFINDGEYINQHSKN